MTQHTTTCYAGVDLGGTKIALALGEPKGKILARASCDTHAERGPEQVLADIGALLNRVEANAGLRARSIGLGLPGLADPLTGTSLFLPNLPGNWRGVPVSA